MFESTLKPEQQANVVALSKENKMISQMFVKTGMGFDYVLVQRIFKTEDNDDLVINACKILR